MGRFWRLKRSHKIVLIGFLPSVLLLALAVLLVYAGGVTGDRLRREELGLTAAQDVLRAIQQTQRYRSQVLLASNNKDAIMFAAPVETEQALARVQGSVDALADDSLSAAAANLAREWKAMSDSASGRQRAPHELMARHAQIVSDQLLLLETISASSGLNLHKGVSGHYLALAALQHLPAMTETMAQMRTDGVAVLAKGKAPEADRIRIAALAGEMEASLRSAARSLALALSADKSRRAPLSGTIDLADKSAHSALGLVNAQFIAASAEAMRPTDFFAELSRDIDTQFSLINASIESVRSELINGAARSGKSVGIVAAVFAFLFFLTVVAMVALVRADRNRTESDMRFQSILDGAPDGVVIADEHGKIALVNRAAERMFGFTQATAVGTNIADHAAQDSKAAIETDLIELRSGTIGSAASQFRELIGVKADGATFPIEVTRSLFQASRGCWTISVVRDVSARRHLEMQLQQSQKMEAIGQLTGGVAHDFNNLLGVIVGNLDLLESSVQQMPMPLKRVHTAQKAALRAADLTKRLLAFSRKQHLEPAAIRVEDSIANLVEMASRTLGPEIKIVTDIAAKVPLIYADPGGLENVLLNLAVNARDAMRDGGTIAIAAGPAELDDRHPAVKCGDVKPGRYVSIRVSDTGHGIPRDKLERVFEPFFTTKEQGKGTGLGLSMVYGFVKQTGGNVKIYSEEGVGTTISLILPIAAGPSETVVTGTHIATREVRQGTTALVVDDEPDLLDIAVAYLEEMGYRVLQANDGNAALRTLEKEGQVDLLMTDVLMPGMNGVKLTQHVRAARPGVKVVFTSGFPAQALAERSGTAVDGPLLNKPFLKREFSAVVNRVMEGELV